MNAKISLQFEVLLPNGVKLAVPETSLPNVGLHVSKSDAEFLASMVTRLLDPASLSPAKLAGNPLHAAPVSADAKGTPPFSSAEELGYNQIEAAKVLGISTVTLWRDTKLGKIHRTSRGIYPRSELERYLRNDLIKNEFKEKRRKVREKRGSNQCVE